MAKVKKGNKRRALLLDKAFQFKISFYLVLVTAISSFCILYVLLAVQEKNIALFSQILENDLSSLRPIFTQNKIILFLITIGIFIFLSVILFLLGVYYSQKIIGPILRIRRHMETALYQNLNVDSISLRKEDYLHHIKDTYNQMLEYIKDNNKKYLSKSKPLLEKLEHIENIAKNNEPSFSMKNEINFIKREINKEKND